MDHFKLTTVCQIYTTVGDLNGMDFIIMRTMVILVVVQVRDMAEGDPITTQIFNKRSFLNSIIIILVIVFGSDIFGTKILWICSLWSQIC